jgi:hypothetical protein
VKKSRGLSACAARSIDAIYFETRAVDRRAALPPIGRFDSSIVETALSGFVTPAAACWMYVGAVAEGMRKISYAGYRFPPEVIRQAIWLYLRFTLSFRDVEDLLAERGIAVSYETVRRWVNHFGPMIAAHLRKRRPKPHATWHLDEVYLKIDGRMVINGAPSTLRARFSMCWSSPSATRTPL